MEQSYLEISKIVNTHGLKGDIKVVPWADYPEIFDEIDYVYTADGKEYEITYVKYQKNLVILHLDSVTTIEQAEKMRDKILYVKKDDMPPLSDDTYYVADLIGLCVKDDDREYGTIYDVLSNGGADVYVVKRKGEKDLLIPAAKEFISEVNISDKYVKVCLPEGLLEL